MSKTRDYIKSGQSRVYRDLTDEKIEIIEDLENEWEKDNSVIFFDEDDYETKVEYYYGVTVETHEIFDGESDGRVEVLDCIAEGKKEWENILEDYSFYILELCEEQDPEKE